MNADDAWKLIRSGATDAGLAALRRNFEEKRLMGYGSALLFLEEYQAAWEHFSSFAHREAAAGRGVDLIFGMAGAAKWCLSEYGEAVAEWRAGLTAPYRDANGVGVTIPLLLFVSSVLHPSTIDRHEAKEILLKRAKHRRMGRQWPCPLVHLVLGQIDEEKLWSEIPPDDKEARLEQWRLDFYTSILRFSTRRSYCLTMRQLVERLRNRWADMKGFIDCTKHEEFFIARHEAAKL